MKKITVTILMMISLTSIAHAGKLNCLSTGNDGLQDGVETNACKNVFVSRYVNCMSKNSRGPQTKQEIKVCSNLTR